MNKNKELHGYIVFSSEFDWEDDITDQYNRYYVIAKTLSKAKYKAYKIELKKYGYEINFMYWLNWSFKNAICLDEYFERQNQMTIDEI